MIIGPSLKLTVPLFRSSWQPEKENRKIGNPDPEYMGPERKLSMLCDEVFPPTDIDSKPLPFLDTGSIVTVVRPDVVPEGTQLEPTLVRCALSQESCDSAQTDWPVLS